ncbi:MAG: hypothetical protein RBS77_03680 [Candidatus Moranbacteria bacterium]|jgi:hypothetical protein|nr:hypothetical protein [Candidatus Moranbacteria bacterium]
MLKKYIEYLKDNPKGYWFKAKLFGWGWTPVTWQGWLITLIYVALLILFALTIDENSLDREVLFTFVLPVVLLTITFIRVAYKKGEKPRWNWGWPKK